MNHGGTLLSSWRGEKTALRTWQFLFCIHLATGFALAGHPTWLAARTGDVSRDPGGQPTYVVVSGGDVRLPPGLAELRIIGDSVVAVTSRRWEVLKEEQRRTSVLALAGRGNELRDVAVFRPSGRLAATCLTGKVEVYP